MSVKIRMKKMGRPHRPFFRVCAMDIRAPRDGKVIEELGYYDPMVPDTDARAILNGERIAYWLSVGAQTSDKVKVLIRKYGQNGTHLELQQAALERRKTNKSQAPAPYKPPPKPEPVAAEPPTAEENTEEATPEAEAPATETPAAE